MTVPAEWRIESMLMWLRAGLTLLATVLFLIISIPVYLILWIVGKFSQEAKDIASLRFIQGGLHFVWFFTGCRLTVIGRENIPKDQAVLYIGNHRSIFDAVITIMQLPSVTGYLAKIQLSKIPLLRQWAHNLHVLFLDRDDIRQGLQVILSAIDEIKAGHSIFIFPEGTRSKEEGVILPFHGGSFKVATKAKCPIIPVTLVNTGDIFEDHWPKIKAVHVIVEYGKPIDVASLSPEEKKHIAEYVQDIIAETYEKDKALL